MDLLTETMKEAAIRFATWMEDNAWTCVWSQELHKRSYVDASRETILVNCSDFHYTTLVKEVGKTIDELWDLFVMDERVRLEKIKVSNANEPMKQKTEACINPPVSGSVCPNCGGTMLTLNGYIYCKAECGWTEAN